MKFLVSVTTTEKGWRDWDGMLQLGNQMLMQISSWPTWKLWARVLVHIIIRQCTCVHTHTHQGRYANSIAGFGGAFPNFSEENDNVDGGMNLGIHGYGGGDVRSRRTIDATPQPSALANSLQINNTRPEGQVSLRFGSNTGGTNYQQQYQPTRGDGAGTDRTIGSKPRKKAGKLYKPFQASVGNSYVFPTRRENWQGRQGATGGQRAAHSNAAQMGRRWESSAYNQQEYGGQVNHRSAYRSLWAHKLLGGLHLASDVLYYSMGSGIVV